ncbi:MULTISPECIES: bacteriorhodopsin [Hymenobacter]|uniref:Bacteriorhodopsin n=1 Tax=Hymenobacter lapidiphilus TaxID=2608003 RepID=A0A7Y7PS30_9BACT|nr:MULTISPECIES: bacteriorhodopsin [Hymenobacter]NVO32794.1 bacteriorhodopsin [Hymenobacter lapidiphilus]RFP64055.1 rhodopsin [Hymenobacter sp. CCM 8763]
MAAPLFLAEMLDIRVDDPIAFTFFTGYMAMLAASVFFFAERSAVEGKWKLSLLVSGLITGIAAVHYYYMRDYYLATQQTPTALRYIDWTLTVPLMCVEFYLLTKAAGAKIGLLWRLIAASVLMLVAGYIGEAFTDGSTFHSVLWGSISTVGYVYILYTAWYGEVAQLAKSTGDEIVIKGIRALGWFVLVGWAIYPIGYMCMKGGWLNTGLGWEASSVDLFYNIADVINKIGFGLVIYGIAVSGKSAAAVNETMPTAPTKGTTLPA